MAEQTPNDIAAHIWSILLAADSAPYIGEPVSQFQHALQAADRAAELRCPQHVVLAALLHDIGHLIDADAEQMDGLGAHSHEDIGATFLKEMGFSAETQFLVQSHVDAKRYLCVHKPGYWSQLSSASRATLTWQGGPMTEAECRRFEQHAHFKDALRVRSFDEQAKMPNYVSSHQDLYKRMIANHLTDEIKRIKERLHAT